MLLVSGFWGQNIGNAFFNLGGRAALEAAGHDVSFVQDMPAYATFRNESKGNWKHAYPLLDHLEFDLLVLQGPLFTRNFAAIWREQLGRLARRGVRWAVLGGALRKYSPTEVEIARALIAETPPLFVSTRDDETYVALAGVPTTLRRGVDSAFFLPEAFAPPRMSGPPVIAMTFDHFAEPRLLADPAGPLEIDGRRFRLEGAPGIDRIAARSKAHALALRALRRSAAPGEVDGVTIVRPDHRTNPHLPVTIYKDPNGLASDEPWTYLTVYANCDLTVADRVHACVATLAYGGQAMLWNPVTRRCKLFDAIGVPDVARRPVRLAAGVREQWFAETVDFLSHL